MTPSYAAQGPFAVSLWVRAGSPDSTQETTTGSLGSTQDSASTAAPPGGAQGTSTDGGGSTSGVAGSSGCQYLLSQASTSALQVGCDALAWQYS